jgi:hypothetical protein
MGTAQRVFVQHSQTFDTITRLENTTAYGAGDTITGATPAPLKFSKSAAQAGQGGSIKSVTIISDLAQSTKLDADLFLFDAPPAVTVDNLAFAPTDAEMLTLVAVVSVIGTTAANTKIGGANQAFINVGLDIPFVCARGDSALYGILVARNAYVPGSAEVLRVKLGVQPS